MEDKQVANLVPFYNFFLEELTILDEIIADADKEYHEILNRGGTVSSGHFEWIKMLNRRRKYLSVVLDKVNAKIEMTLWGDLNGE